MKIRELFELNAARAIGMLEPLAGLAKPAKAKAAEVPVEKSLKKAATIGKVAAAADEKDKTSKHVAFCFGRMNPPHYGHKSLMNAVKGAANGGDWFIFTSKSHDNKKNPLPYNEKVQWIRAINPELGDHFVEDPSVRTYLEAASYLYKMGYRSATFVAGDEDMAAMWPHLENYNGKGTNAKGQPFGHGYYHFEPLTAYENPRETSATSARQAAINNDPAGFESATRVPSSLKVNGKTLFQAVRQGMGLDVAKEMMALPAGPEFTAGGHDLLSMEDAPKGWEGTVKGMKKHKDIDNPWALAHWMKNKGYKSHKKESADVRLEALEGMYNEMLQEQSTKVTEGTTNASGIKAKGITKKPDPTQKAAMKNAITMPDLNQSSGSAYLGWRMGIALAGAPDYPTKAEADNWIGGDPLLSPYTEEEAEMVKAASLAVGGGRIENWSGKRSQELPTTNKTSAVAKIKKNQYGV